MKDPLLFLLVTRLKNGIREFLKNPAKLVLALVMLLLVGFTVFAGNMSDAEAEQTRPIGELYALITGVYALVFALTAKSGFSGGASLFGMPDVNLIFPAPIKPARALLYGLVQQIKTSLLLGFFILFQYTWMHVSYGITFLGLLWILLGYAATVFMAQLSAMVLYIFTSSDEKARKGGLTAFWAVLLGYAAGIAYTAFSGGMAQLLPNLVAAMNSWGARLFPVGGWLGAAAAGALGGDALPAIVGLGLTAALLGGMLFAVIRSKGDFYEDVLATTEQAFSAITARKQGQLDATPKNITVGKTGLTRGEGASVFYYKHLLENRRASRFPIPTLALVFIVCSVGFGYFVREQGLLPIVVFNAYLQLFASTLGRMPKELLKPYLYMVPEPPFRKLWNSLRESFPGFVLQALLIYIPVSLYLPLPLWQILGAILLHCSFSLLFLSGNVLVERVFGSLQSKFLIYIFYFGSLLFLCVPAVAAGILTAVFVPDWMDATALSLLSASAMNLLLSIAVLYGCRNLLQYAELNNR